MTPVTKHWKVNEESRRQYSGWKITTIMGDMRHLRQNAGKSMIFREDNELKEDNRNTRRSMTPATKRWKVNDNSSRQ